MDFRLSIGFDLPREALRNIFYDMIRDALILELNIYEAEISDWSDAQQVSISCTYFSLGIDLDEEEEYLERFREMNLEAYGVDTNVLVNIQFITRTFDIGWLKLLKIIGKILIMNDGDLILEDDSTYPLLKRIKGSLLINSNLDDYRTWYMTKENLGLLNYPYEERIL
ncbi:hypothetical protein [Paenibacillus sp. IHBB 3054]|uniref:hypothetical protein n=1 Tax=Paenibacillus sp. IHBB 3054 TaxID=3425689 RepID=UPI003F679B95